MPNYRKMFIAAALACCLALALPSFADNRAILRGTVRDSLGASVPDATINVVQAKSVFASRTTNSEGNYRVELQSAGRYRLEVSAKSFGLAVISDVYVSNYGETTQDVILSPGALNTEITVTATGTPTPESQLGTSVTVISQEQFRNAVDVQQPLRLMPGAEMSQTGQTGATNSLFIRGGNSDANKVLLDGIPTNFVGGFAEFANLPAVGIDRIEVLRGPNSALYGSDALAGVVSLTTARGTTALPFITYAVDGGNFGTNRQEGTIGGTFRQFDYFNDFAAFNTQGNLPNDAFHNATYAGNFGWTPHANTNLRVTYRHVANHLGAPNATELYVIPDDSIKVDRDNYLGITFDNWYNDRWHNILRYGRVRLHQIFTDQSPTGIPFGSVFLGAPVTLQGANGFSVSGQAVYQFDGIYPSVSLNTTNRDFLHAQSDYRISSHLMGLVAFKYEKERGSNFFTGSTLRAIDRENYSYTLQLSGDVKSRLYYLLSSGVENNGLFGFEATPRASLAYYLVRPSGTSIFNGTKLHASFGKGIKEPSISQEFSSLFGVLSGISVGTQLIQQFGISPVGPQRSRTFDGGITQELFNGNGKVGVTWFYNQFSDVVEFVPKNGLLAFGVPSHVANSVAFGAYVNSQAFQAQGLELEGEYRIGSNWFLRAGYTYLDAVIEKSLSSDALLPSVNPLFPEVTIGAFSPLKGARPFRRAPHSGYLAISYSRPRWYAQLSSTLVGRRDDSTFLSDKDFGNTLLLPNRNLDAAYQRVDLSGGYNLRRSVQIFAAMQNVLSQHYSEVFGYPSLPFTFRAGMKFSFGGESWKIK